MTTLICCDEGKFNEFEKQLEKMDKVKIIKTKCFGLDELQPVVLKLPEGIFYGNVTTDRMKEVAYGSAGDLKIQTARLFDITMKKYMSESQYRDIVNQFRKGILSIDELTIDNIEKLIKEVSEVIIDDYLLKDFDVTNSIMVSLIKSTKGPDLVTLVYYLGKNEVIKRIDAYLSKYKHRL